MNQPKGEFTAAFKDGHVIWLSDDKLKKQGFRLEKATYQPGSLGLPLENEIRSFGDMEQSFILVGERGSGFGYFQKWLNENTSKSKQWKTFSLRNMGKQDTEIYESFINEQGGYYILDRTAYGASTIRFEEDPQKLAQIGATLEREEWRNSADNRFIVFTYDISNLVNDLLFSVMFDRVHLFRLPMFTPEELEVWLTHVVKPTETDNHCENSEIIYQLIGGQPKLCRSFFDHLAPLIGSKSETAAIIQKAGHKILKQPPNIVHRWKESLKTLLDKKPACKRLLETYVEGFKRDEDAYVDEDIDLYLQGWLAKDVAGKWGIRSQSHRELAVQTLRGDL